LPRGRAGPVRPLFFSGATGLPGSSSRDGGLDELPELRDSRRSSRASLSASASLTSCNSASCPAIALICQSCASGCPAGRATTTSSSSRDNSSGPDTRRSNRTEADHQVIDTPPLGDRPKINMSAVPSHQG
jgi:hypothetical protein